jgi:hypothetical protein
MQIRFVVTMWAQKWLRDRPDAPDTPRVDTRKTKPYG